MDTSYNIPCGINDGKSPPLPLTLISCFWVDTMTYALSKFISIPTISSDPAHREDCRQGAIWLKKCLSQLGAETTLVRSDTLFPFLMMGDMSLVTDGRRKPTGISYI